MYRLKNDFFAKKIELQKLFLDISLTEVPG